MPVEMIIDQWNPSRRRYRTETFCYGPLSCRLYPPSSSVASITLHEAGKVRGVTVHEAWPPGSMGADDIAKLVARKIVGEYTDRSGTVFDGVTLDFEPHMKGAYDSRATSAPGYLTLEVVSCWPDFPDNPFRGRLF